MDRDSRLSSNELPGGATSPRVTTLSWAGSSRPLEPALRVGHQRAGQIAGEDHPPAVLAGRRVAPGGERHPPAGTREDRREPLARRRRQVRDRGVAANRPRRRAGPRPVRREAHGRTRSPSPPSDDQPRSRARRENDGGAAGAFDVELKLRDGRFRRPLEERRPAGSWVRWPGTWRLPLSVVPGAPRPRPDARVNSSRPISSCRLRCTIRVIGAAAWAERGTPDGPAARRERRGAIQPFGSPQVPARQLLMRSRMNLYRSSPFWAEARLG